MILDDRKHIGELGLRQILKARQSVSKRKTIRSFRLPKLNFEANGIYENMVHCNDCDLTSPSLLQDISGDVMNSLIQSGTVPEWDVKGFPCHTQAVERCCRN
ncbi:hypothetical protein AVEN_134363-1 [Araneus ventricosus]|uniref:Uncharacterized protein n=1 Tax=Araneus ventricosus TaxID=182803 RepID=A0A4Y2K412_ARAVE|nr:hypothetical protein AVEN_134363-1 [Araneus ventricosus]